MLTAFLSSPAASVQGQVLGVEEEIRGMLVEGVPDLYGRVDLLTEDADRLVVTDIKTSRGRWSQEQVEDSGEQLLLYSHLASEIAPGKKIATRFLVLTKTKEPVVEEHVREVEPGNVKRTLAGVERVWRAIESGVFYPAPSALSCSSCGLWLRGRLRHVSQRVARAQRVAGRNNPDTPAVRDAVARSYDNIAAMDRWVRERLAELDEAGLLDDTIVILFSDHGVGLPRGKR